MAVTLCGSGISRRTVGSRKPSTSIDLDAAAGENARQQLRQVVLLRDRKRTRRRPLVEPVAPGPAADRALDVEEQPRGRCWRRAKAIVMEALREFEFSEF